MRRFLLLTVFRIWWFVAIVVPPAVVTLSVLERLGSPHNARYADHQGPDRVCGVQGR